MIFLILAALFGGLLTSVLFWFWQGDWWFALLLAPIGGSFAALLAAATLVAVRSSSVRAFFVALKFRRNRANNLKPALAPGAPDQGA